MNSKAFREEYFDIISLMTPGDGAFIHEGMSRKQLFGLAAGFASAMMEIDDGKPVCLCTEEKAVILAACIAAISTGATLVLPYSFSSRVLLDTREAAGFSRIITGNMESPLPGVALVAPEPGSWSIVSRTMKADPDREFLRIFTGGSTGTPKAWPKTPRNLIAEALYLARKFSFTEKDVILATVPPYHIYGLLFSVLVPFVSGASVLPGVYTFPHEICTTLIEKKATVLVSVPVHYRILKGCGFSGHSLRAAFSSAGALDAYDAEAFHSMTRVGVREIYGSTETGGIAWRCRADGDEFMRPFETVSWKAPHGRLTVKSGFISPGLPRDSEGYFITGDIVVKKESGLFQLIGRSDGVVKVAGKRVDLGDMRDKLMRVEGVSDVYLIPIRVRSGRGNDIAALIEGTVDEVEMKRIASELLEPYAVPKRLKVVDKIPVLSTGKYDTSSIEELLQKTLE